jgi:CrcB protein
MKALLLVAVGGSMGAVARFKLGTWVLSYNPDGKFPAGTFVVNIVGCLIAGVLVGLAEKYNLFSDDAHLFLFVGLLGGFTTFSAFGAETVALMRRGDLAIAGWYVGLSVLCGIVMLWGGLKLVLWASR